MPPHRQCLNIICCLLANLTRKFTSNMNDTVRSYLIEKAKQRTNQTVTYQQLCDDCRLRLNMQEITDRNEIGKILDEISRYEHTAGRPLLSALVMRAVDNYEGDGFYKLAEDLGYGDWQRLKREGIFEIQQIRDCIQFWSNDANYSRYR